MNLYTYCHNEPISYIDPSEHDGHSANYTNLIETAIEDANYDAYDGSALNAINDTYWSNYGALYSYICENKTDENDEDLWNSYVEIVADDDEYQALLQTSESKSTNEGVSNNQGYTDGPIYSLSTDYWCLRKT